MLAWPVVGRFFKWRHARLALQIPVFAVAALMIFDGLVGPQLAPKNLATTGAWLHYRGLVVLALLVAGNLFCMACPFMLPRRLGARLRAELFGDGHRVPRALRSKWLTVVLLVLFFYAYERYSLWASPWLTAWVAIGYFLAAFVVDTWFQGAAFCKYVCPLGQFNFFGSLVSPLEFKVRDANICASCRTKDCIKGRGGAEARRRGGVEEWRSGGVEGRPGVSVSSAPLPLYPSAPGCELWLFQQEKAGNMDCTFCLDCVHACPYDNVGLIGRVPTRELWTDPFRSGIGRFSQRTDLAGLVLVITFAAFVNAFSMIKPVYAMRERIMAALGLASPTPVLLVTFGVGLILLPALLAGLAGWLSRRFGQQRLSLLTVIRRFVYALVPIGFGMWLAHYSFHFLIGGMTVVPVAQSFLADVGLYGGQVQWGLGAVVPGEWLFPIEAIFLYLGATASIIVAFQIAQNQVMAASEPQDKVRLRSRTLGAAWPWMALTLLMLGVGLWIMLQPMEMRGTMMMYSLPGG